MEISLYYIHIIFLMIILINCFLWSTTADIAVLKSIDKYETEKYGY